MVPSGVESPHSLALDPARGLLFWTDLGKQPSIRRAGLDGSNVMTVVALVSGSVTDISLDFEVRTVKLTRSFSKLFFSGSLPFELTFSIYLYKSIVCPTVNIEVYC